jgi:hypothetical protein
LREVCIIQMLEGKILPVQSKGFSLWIS